MIKLVINYNIDLQKAVLLKTEHSCSVQFSSVINIRLLFINQLIFKNSQFTFCLPRELFKVFSLRFYLWNKITATVLSLKNISIQLQYVHTITLLSYLLLKVLLH